MRMMSHVKVCSSTTYHIILAKFGELPMEIYALKLQHALNNGSPTYPLLVSE